MYILFVLQKVVQLNQSSSLKIKISDIYHRNKYCKHLNASTRNSQIKKLSPIPKKLCFQPQVSMNKFQVQTEIFELPLSVLTAIPITTLHRFVTYSSPPFLLYQLLPSMSDLQATDKAADGKTEQPSTTFVFGSNSTLLGSGFGGVISGQPEASSSTGATLGASADQGDTAPDQNEGPHTGEEDCSLEYAPVVQLEEVQTTTGEEAEINVFDCKTKLYRFDQAGNEWKERGVGVAKILKHKENGKVRFLFREDKTLKIRSNHLIMPGTTLQNHAGSEKAIVWSAVDFADEEQKVELLCLRFGSEEKAQIFRTTYEESMGVNQKLLEKDAGADAGGTEEEAAKKEDEEDKKVENKEEVVEKLADKVEKEIKVTEE
eukprot:TRINITY_DN1661_c0_g1_i3.p1 TRINITY_DN1661_c0_g1~~TRINITY_DN1661_c0_g1_i3.p1  ORF type:complete len:394 (+),score=78.96 TRINITY_DN1661_c0_g1_i3:62-1183(+)